MSISKYSPGYAGTVNNRFFVRFDAKSKSVVPVQCTFVLTNQLKMRRSIGPTSVDLQIFVHGLTFR